MEEKEKRLVEMVLAGKTDAFEPLITPYRESLFALALRLTGDTEDAKEAVQDALLRAFRYLRGYDLGRSFKNWLLKILVNETRKQARKRSRRARSGTEEIESIPSPAAGPADIQEKKELRSRLSVYLENLTLREKEVFLLRDIEEKNIRECARMLGCSSVSVRVHLSSARKKLKEKMEREFFPKEEPRP